MKINKQKYYEQYKEIYTTACINGYLIPDILPSVPLEYQFTENEKEKIHNNLNKNTEEQLKEAYKQRRRKEIELYGHTEKFNEYRLNELKQFLEKFPQYKNIIDGD